MASTNRRRVTALIVDEDRDTRELYALYLSRSGVNTVEAEDGLHGLAKAASIVPDVITTDLVLPRMDGTELCRSLKSAERTRQIPIIVVTGSVKASEVDAAKQAGCISVLTKPCPPDVLLAEIRRVLALPQFAQASVTVPGVSPATKAYQPYSTNKLLASLPPEDYRRIALSLRTVPMNRKHTVHRQNGPIDDVYFPGGGALSLVKTLKDGQIAEVATVGSEGAVGASVFFGQGFADCDVVVQVTGPDAQAMSADVFNAEMDKHGAFFDRVVRYNQALMSQIMQTTVCNSLHSAEQRCCRWLLMTHDRVGADEFPLTHEFLATMLGVRRPTVTLIANSLQQAGLFQYRRGAVRIVNRAKLEAASCECYETIRDQMKRLLPDFRTS